MMRTGRDLPFTSLLGDNQPNNKPDALGAISFIGLNTTVNLRRRLDRE